MAEIIKRKLSTLRKLPGNPRTISAPDLETLKDSLATNPELFDARPIILSDRTGELVIIAGNMRMEAARQIGMKEVPTILLPGLTEAKEREIAIRDNINNGDWDWDLLANQWDDLPLAEWGLQVPTFDMDDEPEPTAQEDEEAVAETVGKAAEFQQKWQTATGQIWKLGEHRLMCGDSTKHLDVNLLMNNEKAILVHADPPYGMGKESDGVANDNLYAEKLDAFQMQWWKAFRPYVVDNGSAYMWGNAPDLWRLWYQGGLCDSERLTLRNEIVWKKPGGFGISSDEMRGYPPQTERCLFFMLGEQGFNTNADNYWEGWEPIRSYLDAERKGAGLSNARCNEVCGKQNMTQSAFTKGGFRLILEEDYNKLREATNGQYFKRDYDELKRDFYTTRAYFDNAHENMTDVWEFPRVFGEERWLHATPKPVAMIERIIKSSSPDGAIVVEPFAGSGTTLIACEQTGRKCYTMELAPEYVAVTLERWHLLTGKEPELIQQ